MDYDSGKKCCLPGCGLNCEILHKFPNPDKDIDRFRTWIYNVEVIFWLKIINSSLGTEEYATYILRLNIRPWSKMLSANAVPTLNLTKFSFIKKHPLIDITNQYVNSPPATPSTSGQLFQKQDEPMDVDNLPVKTAQTVKSSTIKKRPGINKQNLLKEIRKLQKDKDSYKQRLHKAKNVATNSSFQNTLKKFKTLAAIFTRMQFREISKQKMGRRFTKEEKIIALSLYKLGPRAYRWLIKSKKFFISLMCFNDIKHCNCVMIIVVSLLTIMFVCI